MLKEMIQAMVKDPGSLLRAQGGQLQLAGLSDVEQRAFVDVVSKRESGSEPRLFQENVWM
ncbi:competence pheromone ComX [Paenibacillus herberti]|uniref:ComX pheromone n=1 Tax=Paenibacillus herberti TaxID=1619309 RepID=A0A229NY23_9BACL|nr:competence pheromone ComX [Paenibacillus herberti]OXM14798.1 hypothetical protein CGZ75_18170 [Paenibacillus herberti]